MNTCLTFACDSESAFQAVVEDPCVGDGSVGEVSLVALPVASVRAAKMMFPRAATMSVEKWHENAEHHLVNIEGVCHILLLFLNDIPEYPVQNISRWRLLRKLFLRDHLIFWYLWERGHFVRKYSFYPQNIFSFSKSCFFSFTFFQSKIRDDKGIPSAAFSSCSTDCGLSSSTITWNVFAIVDIVATVMSWMRRQNVSYYTMCLSLWSKLCCLWIETCKLDKPLAGWWMDLFKAPLHLFMLGYLLSTPMMGIVRYIRVCFLYNFMERTRWFVKA